MRRVTWPVGRGIPEATLPIHYATLVGLWWLLKVACSWASPLLSIFSRNFSESENGPKICGFGGIKGGKYERWMLRPPRKSIPTESRHPVQRVWRYSQKFVLQSLARKVKKKKKQPNWTLYFTPFPRRPCWADLYHFWHVGSHRRCNVRSRIFIRLIQEFGGYGCQKSGVSHWLW